MYKILQVTLLVLISPVLRAQTTDVFGKIFDQQGPVKASIYIVHSTKSAVSDSLGLFRFSGLSYGAYTFVVQQNEQILAQKKITINEKTGLIEIYLQDNSARQLDIVTVTAPTQASLLQKSPENITVVETKLFYKTSQTALDVLRRTSGIKIRTTGGYGAKTDFYINGISGKQIKFFLDGVPISALGETQGINLIPWSRRLALKFKGVIPIQFGSDALGGAVNMVSRNELTDFVDVFSAVGSFKTTKTNLNIRKFLTDHFYVGVSATYNYSKNDYNVMAEVPDVYGTPSVKNVRRFHNAFRFYNAKFQTGWFNTKWADQLSLIG